MFTTIPYDEGWKVYVDGERVDIYKTCDALLAFDITEGVHTVEMKYFSKAMTVGLILSVSGLAIFVGMILLDHFVFKKRREGKHEAWLVRVEQKKSERLMKEAMELEASADLLADTENKK